LKKIQIRAKKLIPYHTLLIYFTGQEEERVAVKKKEGPNPGANVNLVKNVKRVRAKVVHAGRRRRQKLRTETV